MSVKQTSRYCKSCGKRTLHATSSFSLAAGLILSLLTCGIFLPFWGFIMLGDALRPWRCQMCGKSRMF